MRASAGAQVTSLAEYVDVVNQTSEEWKMTGSRSLWFRGHSDASYELTPSIYRGSFATFERELSRDFRLMAPTYLDKLPQSELSWMYLMQHFGLPTRLLDWSSSHLVALYFALEFASDTAPAAVWMLRPGKLNAAVIGEVTIPTQEHPAVGEYLLGSEHLRSRKVSGAHALAIRPEYESRRIVAQRGGFTLHGNRSLPLEMLCAELESLGHEHIPLECIEIDPTARLKLVRELHLAGVSASVIFPELSGIARELRLRYSDAFIGAKDIAELK